MGLKTPTTAASSSSATNFSTSAPAAHPDKHDELRLLVNSRHPIITVETPEEERLEQLVVDVAAELTVPLFTWSVTTGLAKFRGAASITAKHPSKPWQVSPRSREMPSFY